MSIFDFLTQKPKTPPKKKAKEEKSRKDKSKPIVSQGNQNNTYIEKKDKSKEESKGRSSSSKSRKHKKDKKGKSGKKDKKESKKTPSKSHKRRKISEGDSDDHSSSHKYSSSEFISIELGTEHIRVGKRARVVRRTKKANQVRKLVLY